MSKARTKSTTLATLSTTTLDTLLALTRLRTAHPSPRLTTALANAQLEDQIAAMQDLSDEKDALHASVAAAKDRLRAASLRNEVLRGEKHVREEEEMRLGGGAAGGKDERVVPLYDWYVFPPPFVCCLTEMGMLH